MSNKTCVRNKAEGESDFNETLHSEIQAVFEKHKPSAREALVVLKEFEIAMIADTILRRIMEEQPKKE